MALWSPRTKRRTYRVTAAYLAIQPLFLCRLLSAQQHPVLHEILISFRCPKRVKSEPTEPEVYGITSQDAAKAIPAVVLHMASPETQDRLLRESRYPPGLADIHSYKIRRVSVQSYLDADDEEKENDHPHKRRKL